MLSLVSRLEEYWIYFGHSRECRIWLDRALELTAEDHPDRGRGLAACALHAVWHLDLERAAVRLDQADRFLAGRGEELLEAFVTYVRALAAQIRTAYVLDALAWIADRQGRHQRAAILFGAAHTVWRDIGSSPEIAVSGPHSSHVASARAALGASGYERAHASGRCFTYDEAMSFALDKSTGTSRAGNPV
ncbi:hypothetical protein ACFYO7_28475 [Nocardia salmonicida]|uniref:hypothetical protein n=1 Tax=Nocardia salmonicida TaxID=53431 RepID=UPI00367910C5